METVAVIPARYDSSRLPGKPLAMIGNKPMIMHVYDRVKASGLFSHVCVATDHQDIAEAVDNGGGHYVMTGNDHKTGTERCTEAFRRVASEADVIVNVQGDEPFIQCEPLRSLIDAFHDPEVEIATLATPVRNNEELHSSGTVKVVTDRANKALYFSRSPIPFVRDASKEKWTNSFPYLRHIGIYAFQNKTLEQIATLHSSGLEEAESLEQLRWMENGFPVHVIPAETDTFSVDTPEDLEKAQEYYRKLYNKS